MTIGPINSNTPRVQSQKHSDKPNASTADSKLPNSGDQVALTNPTAPPKYDISASTKSVVSKLKSDATMAAFRSNAAMLPGTTAAALKTGFVDGYLTPTQIKEQTLVRESIP